MNVKQIGSTVRKQRQHNKDRLVYEGSLSKSSILERKKLGAI